MNVDPKLFDYCTPRQREVLEAYEAHGNGATAALALNTDRTYPDKVLRDVKRKAALKGYAPDASNVKGFAPDGFAVKRLSARFDKDGEAAGGWVISEPTKEKALEALQAACEAVLEQSRGQLPLVAPPAVCDADLLTVIPVGDPHFGLMTWAAETGDNFDLKIAERLTFDAVDRLAMSGPNSETCLFLNLGDYFHADNSTNRTPRSGASLDVDGRFDKIAAVGVGAMVRCIRRLLEKHQRVIVRNNRGNHDPHQASMLTLALQGWFHNEPRVQIEATPSSFYYHSFGNVLIGSTHGDGAKLNDLPLIMATDAPQQWADAKFRVWHCGHFHHDQLKEHPGCTVETHRTLAAGDAWHRHSGYRSGRDMKAVIYHRTHGEVTRIRCGISMLEEAA